MMEEGKTDPTMTEKLAGLEPGVSHSHLPPTFLTKKRDSVVSTGEEKRGDPALPVTGKRGFLHHRVPLKVVAGFALASDPGIQRHF